MADAVETTDEKRVDARAAANVKLHDRAMSNFDQDVLPQIPVRELALIARRFVNIPGAMWEGAAGDQYGDSIKLEFPKLRKKRRKLRNDIIQNRVVPDFRPAGGESDNDTADTLDGMHRADSYYFKAQQGRDNAYEEAGDGGFGAYRLCAEWADPLDKDNDHQRVNPADVIVDADQKVFFGPSSRYDKSDAKRAYLLVGMTRDAFEEEYPDAVYSDWPTGMVRTPNGFDWFRGDTIAVCEYYEIEEKDEYLLIFEQETSGEEVRHWEKELDAGDRTGLKARGYKERRRRHKRQRCHKWILSGAEVLEDCGYIAGKSIPLVPVYCERVTVDGVEWFRGLVQQDMDMVRVFNAVMSSLYEITTLAPYERPIFAAEQMPSNLADMWARGNIDRHPYALVNPLLDPVTGGIAALGPIGKVETPQVPATMAAMVQMLEAQFSDDDQDPDQVKANTSADAMDIAAARVDAKSGVILDNIRQSTVREGELYLDMVCEVYAEPDREVETMTEDGDDGVAKLHEDYSDNGDLKVRNNFAVGKYKVMATVTEATSTRRDRTAKLMLNTAQLAGEVGDQEGAQAALITAGMNMDGEGLSDYQAWNRKRALKLGLVEPNEDEKKQAAEDAEQQQPDPQAMVIQAQMQKLTADAQKAMADAGLSQAKIQEVMASAGLKQAQTEALGGPEAAPDVPSGLQAANDRADVIKKVADADHATAQAAKIRAELPMQRIRMGHEIEAHQADMSERAA